MDLTSRSIIFFLLYLSLVLMFVYCKFPSKFSSFYSFYKKCIFRFLQILFLEHTASQKAKQKMMDCCYVCCSYFLIIQTAHDTAQFSYYQLFYGRRGRLDYYNVTCAGGGQQDQPPSLGSASSRGSDWKLTWSWRWSILVS